MDKTRGQIEAEITSALIKFEKEYLGRGPTNARTFIIEDMVIVRLRGVLTPAEMKLAESGKGQALVKESRRQLFDTSRERLDQIINDITGCRVVSLHKDLSTRTGERLVVFTLSGNLEEKFK